MSTASEVSIESMRRDVAALRESGVCQDMAFVVDQKMFNNIWALNFPRMTPYTADPFRSSFYSDFGVPFRLYGAPVYIVPTDVCAPVIDATVPAERERVEQAKVDPFAVWQILVMVIVACLILCGLAAA